MYMTTSITAPVINDHSMLVTPTLILTSTLLPTVNISSIIYLEYIIEQINNTHPV